MTKYGYARVSTTGQASKGNSLEDQKNLLIDAGVSEKIYILTALLELKWTDQNLMC